MVSCGASVVADDDEDGRLKVRRGVKPDEEDEELDEGELFGELVGRDSDEERKRPREAAALVGAASVVVVPSVWVCWRRDGRRKRLEPPRWLALGSSVVVVAVSVVAADDFLSASDGRLLRSMAPGLTTDTSFLRPFAASSAVVVFSIVGSVTGSGSTNSSWSTGAASASTGASASAGAAGSSTPKSKYS